MNMDERIWQGVPGFERTSKGRMFATWFSGGDFEPHQENAILLATSDDQGKSFSEPWVIADVRDGFRAYDPALWIDPNGLLWLIYCRGNEKTAEHGIYVRTCSNPDASTPEWSDEKRIGFDVPFSFRSTKPTVLKSGAWVMPVVYSTQTTHAWFPPTDQNLQLQGVGISNDQGKTWDLHGSVKTPPWALESMVVELRDGRLWMLVRTNSGYLWQSYSEDGGLTWGEETQSNIANPGSRYFICRLLSGNLLLVNHYQFKIEENVSIGRSNLTAHISTDDGYTWNEGLLLDERENVSYPDGVQAEDGTVWIIYDRERYKDREILLCSFKEEDVLQGKNVSGQLRLKQIINRV